MMLQQKQVEIEKHQSELQSSVAELEHRDKEISDREARLGQLFKTVQDKDSLLREFSDENERLTRELQIAKVPCLPAPKKSPPFLTSPHPVLCCPLVSTGPGFAAPLP